ncbi:MAG TPA: GDSL-type esterase/lipase family protein [Anaerolineaceae bacterium]|nr:GDSL-type esterase/lipase family protein [Anaerolineaceae bacterium]
MLIVGISCSEQEQIVLQTQVALAGKTAIPLLQTQAPPLQTQFVRAAKTSVSEGIFIAQTQSVPIRETTLAGLATQLINTYPTVTPKQPVIDYFALGDSIASGHGLKDDGSPCQRSTNAYPYDVKNDLENRFTKVNFYHFACSGATLFEPDSKTIKQDKYKWFNNQVNDVVTISKVSERPTLVTITIGGNDLGFDNLPFFLTALRLSDAPGYINWIDDLVDKGIRPLLQAQVSKLLSQPNVSVIITEIHNPVNPQSSLFAGTEFAGQCGWISSDCFSRAEIAIKKLNSAIIAIVENIGQYDRLQVTPIYNKFIGHESPPPICGLKLISDTYVQYPGDGYSNSASLLPDSMRKKLNISKGGDCFHPNLKGAKVYADSVNEDAIRVGR